ncbi:hypothetical protein ACCD10_24255 [Pseudomonas sp. Pseusp122]|uniref:hypothetical protein n=1 Tax=unclassified Pseudomonas TaxID=196821 RepID=UPI0039A712D5
MNDKIKSNSLPLRSVQGKILKQITPSLSTARNLVQLKDFDYLMKWAATAQKKGKYIFQERLKALFPKNISRLKRDPILNESSFLCEMAWARALIKNNASHIKEFLELSSELEMNFWAGELGACESLLVKIEGKFGVSLWLLEVKMAILQASQGLEAQKKYLSDVKRDAIQGVKYYAWNFSFRNEDAVTPLRYLNHINNTSLELAQSGQSSSILYKSLPTQITSDLEFRDILRYESNSSVIDLYSTFIELGIDCATSPAFGSAQSKSKFSAALREILPLTNHERLINLLKPEEAALGAENSNWNYLIELFLNGKWQECLNLINTDMLFSTSPQTISIEADCRIFLNSVSVVEANPKLRAKMLNALIDMKLNGNAAEKSINYLFKLRFNFRRFDFSSIIGKWLDDVLLPWKVNSNRLVVKTFSKKLPFDLFSYCPVDGWNKYFSLQVILNSLSENQDWIGVIKETADWDLLDCFQTKKVAILYRQRALLEQKNYLEGVREAVALLIETPSLITHIPVADYVKALDQNLRKELAAEISIPILLHFASKKISKSHERISAFAYEDFLLSRKYRKPSDLASTLGAYRKASLIYYLKYICIADTMKISRVFKSSIDLQNERLLVCRMLIEIDHENKESYETEVREITRAQTIFEGVRHVEKSKISIDVSGLQRWADTHFKEDFNRLKSLLFIESESAKFDKTSEDNKLIGFISSTSKKDEFFFPDNETRFSLIQLYWSLLVAFLYNSEYGLDCYLSMRIRHGVLSGQLRGALESHRVITKRSVDGKTYLSNKYWIKVLSEQKFECVDEVDKLLANFSKELDDLIHHLVNDKIQIASVEKPEGWFRKTFTTNDLVVLQKIVRDQDMTFADFFEASTHVFWHGVDICLKEINEHLEADVKKRVTEIFERLNSSIVNLRPDDAPLPLIRAVTEAKTSYFQSLNVVKEWFSLPSPYEPPMFTFEQLVRVGLECVKKIKPSFDPEIVITGGDVNILSMLTYFSDIFYVIFNNVEEYSGIARPKVSVDATVSGDLLAVEITNQILASAENEESLERIEAAKDLIGSGNYRKNVSVEDLSGFSKIKNLIGEDNLLTFGFTGDQKFTVKFTTAFTKEMV